MAHLLSKSILKARKPDLQKCISKKKFMRKLFVKHKNKCSGCKTFFLEFLQLHQTASCTISLALNFLLHRVEAGSNNLLEFP